MRHRLVHGNFDINLDILWTTVQEGIPMFVALLRKMLGKDEKQGQCRPDRLRQIDAFSRKPNAITGIGSYTGAADFDLFDVD